MITSNGHITRFSDSSLYTEVCVLCNANDGYGNKLRDPCPVERRDATKTELDSFREWNRMYGSLIAAGACELIVGCNVKSPQTFMMGKGCYLTSDGFIESIESHGLLLNYK